MSNKRVNKPIYVHVLLIQVIKVHPVEKIVWQIQFHDNLFYVYEQKNYKLYF